MYEYIYRCTADVYKYISIFTYIHTYIILTYIYIYIIYEYMYTNINVYTYVCI